MRSSGACCGGGPRERAASGGLESCSATSCAHTSPPSSSGCAATCIQAHISTFSSSVFVVRFSSSIKGRVPSLHAPCGSSYTVCLAPSHHAPCVLHRLIMHRVSYITPSHHATCVLHRLIIHRVSYTVSSCTVWLIMVQGALALSQPSD